MAAHSIEDCARVTHHLLEIRLFRQRPQLKVKDGGVRLLRARFVEKGQTKIFGFAVRP